MTQPSFQPYIQSSTQIKEFSLRALFLGIMLGLFFAAANAYLGLKIGTTISASIPSALFSLSFFRMIGKKVTILEHNIVQTISTVGEGLAAGVVFTIPALIFLQEKISILQIFLLSLLGGVLGILFMIPMRRYVIVKEHHVLAFPEGSACAALLIEGEKKAASVLAIWGVILGLVFKALSSLFHLFSDTYILRIKTHFASVFSLDCSPALLGVGYLVGPRISSLMFTGSVLGWWILIPLIQLFGQQATIFPSEVPVSQMGPEQLWSQYIRYIGAGTMAVGGIFSLFRVFPLLFKTVHVGIKELFSGFSQGPIKERTDRDISLKWLILGAIFIIAFLWLYPGFHLNFLTIILLLILGYFFSAVTSITVGIVGSSANPVSGMTLTTLLIVCMIFYFLGWTERIYLVAVIIMSAVTNIAICMAATTSQDLKTGFLLGSTPKFQQIAELIGVLLPSIALGFILHLLNHAFKIGSDQLPAPQASMMAMIAKGVIEQDLPYTLVIVGALIAVALQIIKVPILPFALGVYLPLSLTSTMMVGGLITYFVHRQREHESFHERVRLLCAGLIAGDALMGIIVALLATLGVIQVSQKALLPMSFSLVAFFLLALALYLLAKKKNSN